MKTKKHADEYELYDLGVSVIGSKKDFVCGHIQGPLFKVVGENIVVSKNSKISLYALCAMLALIPVKQRLTHRNDWITTDEEVACPDPNCKARFKIERMRKRKFRHSTATIVPLK